MNKLFRIIANIIIWIRQNTLKAILIVLTAFVALFGIQSALVLYQGKKTAEANASPIVSISAELIKKDREYRQNEEIKADQFIVKAKHENGMETVLNAKDIKLNKNKADYTGDETKIVVILRENEHIITETTVKNQRKALFYFSCGTPNIEDVHAVYYNNGELSFEGKGDVLQYTPETYPWKSYESMEDNPIVSVSFEEGVTPKNLDGWFSYMESLVYVKNIPSTVESMWDTFAGDISLMHTPDWTKCTGLINLKGTFYGCTALESVTYKFPATVTNASYMFYGCSNLQQTPDFSDAAALVNGTSMFEECSKLRVSTVADNMKYLETMFKNCINLRDMPEIPVTVKTMKESFYGCSSMQRVTIIPENVVNVSGCLYGCDKVEGMLWVDANPEEMDAFLEGACVATTLDLQGNSDYLEILANTNTENNVTVFGKLPNRDIVNVDAYEEYQEQQTEAGTEAGTETETEPGSETSENSTEGDLESQAIEQPEEETDTGEETDTAEQADSET